MAEHNSHAPLATPLVTSSLEGIAPNQTTSGLANVEPAQNMPQQTLVTTEPSSVSTSTRELIKGLLKPQPKSPTAIPSVGFLGRFLAGRQEHGEENPDNNPPAPESNSDNSNNSPSSNS